MLSKWLPKLGLLKFLLKKFEEIKDKAIPQNTKHATKYGVKLFKGG